MMEEQMQTSEANEVGAHTESTEIDSSIYGQIQKSVIQIDYQCCQLKEEVEGKKTQLVILEENIQRQRHNIKELQMTAEGFKVKTQSETMNRNLRMEKLAKINDMGEVLQEFLELISMKLNRICRAKESIAKFHTEFEENLNELYGKIDRKQMKIASCIDTLKDECQEVENDKIRQKEEFKELLSQYNEGIDNFKKDVSNLEANINSAMTEKQILDAVVNQKSIQLEEAVAERTVLENDLHEKEAETTRIEQELQSTYADICVELTEKKDLVQKQNENASTLTEQLWRQEDESQMLAVRFKDQVILTEQSLQNIDKVTAEIAAKEESIAVLEKEIEKSADVDRQFTNIKRELDLLKENIEISEKENSELEDSIKNIRLEINKLSEEKDLLQVDQVDIQKENDTLQNDIEELSLENENLSRSCQLLQDEGEKVLMTLQKEEEDLIQENLTLCNKIEIYNNKMVIETSVVDKKRKEIMAIETESNSERKKMLEIEKKIKVQVEDHEMNLSIYETMYVTTKKEYDKSCKALKEQEYLQDSIKQLETKLEKVNKQRVNELQSMKENHRHQIEAEQKLFNQLKLQTNNKLQISAENFKINQNELDKSTTKRKELEANINKTSHFLQNKKIKLNNYVALIKKLQNKLIIVTQVAQNSQTSFRSQILEPSSTTKKDYDSDTDSGTSFVCPKDEPWICSRKLPGGDPHGFNMHKKRAKLLHRKISTQPSKK